MSKKVGRKVHDLVDAGKSTMRKNPMMREVVEAGIGTAIGAVLPRHGRGSAVKDTLMEHVDAMTAPAARGRGHGGGKTSSSRSGKSRTRSGGRRSASSRTSSRSRSR
jgi:hypothetical protein